MLQMVSFFFGNGTAAWLRQPDIVGVPTHLFSIRYSRAFRSTSNVLREGRFWRTMSCLLGSLAKKSGKASGFNKSCSTVPITSQEYISRNRSTNMRRSDKQGLRGNETAGQKRDAGMMGDLALHRAGGGQPRGKWTRAD